MKIAETATTIVIVAGLLMVTGTTIAADHSMGFFVTSVDIGKGPWYNARGELIASDLDQLHLVPNIVKRTALDENGNLVNGRGDKPNKHDILTGSKDDGTAYFPWEKGDHTCSNWTSSEDGKGSAQVGHHDRHGGGNTSWNSTHPSRGCSQQNLVSTGGEGFLYCFAAD